MKRFVSFFLMLTFMVFLFGCREKSKKVENGSATASFNETEVSPDEPTQDSGFKRLKTVTVYKTDGESHTYDINWKNGTLSFLTEDGEEISAGIENDILSYHLMDEEDVFTCNMLAFDEQGRVSAVCGYDGESRDVFYDENGWIQGELAQSLEVNVSGNKFSVGYKGGVMADYSFESRKMCTLGKNNNVVKVDLLERKKHSSGEITEALVEDFESLTYDESGNLLKYSTENWTIKYAYSDESICHNWERLAPFLCLLDVDDDSAVLAISYSPLFWNIK